MNNKVYSTLNVIKSTNRIPKFLWIKYFGSILLENSLHRIAASVKASISQILSPRYAR